MVTAKKKELVYLFSQGLILYKKKNFKNALEIDNDNAQANAFLGKTLYTEDPENEEKLKESISYLRKAIKDNPDLEDAHFTLAQIYDKKRLTDDAIKEYKATIRLNPKNHLAFYYLGILYYEKKQFENARDAFEKCTKILPTFTKAFMNLGTTLVNLRKSQEAIEAFEKAVKLEPDYANAYKSLGLVLLSEKKYDKSIIAFKKAIELEKNYYFYLKLAEAYYKNKDFVNAELNYEESLEKNHKHSAREKLLAADANRNLAQIAVNSGNAKKAEELALNAVKLTPNNPDNYLTYFILGEAYSGQGKSTDAITAYSKSIQIKNDYIKPYINLGELLMKTESYDQTLNVLLKAEKMFEKSVEIKFNIGLAYLKKKLYDDAQKYFENALNLDSTSVKIMYNLGITYLENNKDHEAIQIFTKIIKTNKTYSDAYFQLGLALMKIKQNDKARQILESLLIVDPNYPELAKVKSLLTSL